MFGCESYNKTKFLNLLNYKHLLMISAQVMELNEKEQGGISMKRCIKWVISWIAERINEKDWEEIVGVVIAGLLGIVLGIMFYTIIDRVPANPMDYDQLEEQVNSIQQNPDLLLKTDYDINIKDEIITVEFENDECKITVKYDKNFEVLSTSKEDKSIFWLWALAIALFIVGSVWYVGSVVVALIIALLELCILSIYVGLKSIKSALKK